MKRRTIVIVLSTIAFLAIPISSADARPAPALIAFSSNRAGPAHIFTIRSDGTDEHQLTSDAMDDIQPSWSPDASHIAFSRGAVDGASNFASTIWVMKANGGSPVGLPAPAGTSNFRPVWSPDGTRIAFSRSNGGMTGAIWIMNADGSNQKQLTAGTALDDFPAWSPHGHAIAFFSTRDGGGDIYVIQVGGQDPADVRRLTTGASGRAPSWAPGRTIVFSGPGTGGTGGQIWEIGSDGSGRHQLTATTGEDRFPAWGRGHLLAFSHSASPGCSNGPCGYQIWVKQGSHVAKQVTFTPGAGLPPGESSPSIA